MVVAFYDNGTEAVGLQYPDINYVIRTTLLFFTLINYSVVHIVLYSTVISSEFEKILKIFHALYYEMPGNHSVT